MNRLPAIVLMSTFVALTAPTVHAVHLDPQGMGQVLIYPYYTVNGGRTTLLSVVNTTTDAKAIKLRLREGVHGRSVLDLNLYLSPYDVYAGAVVSSGDGAPARLVSTDASCTVPMGTVDGSVSMLDARYAGPDDGPPALERTREGWIEVIEMGVLEDSNLEEFDVDRSFVDAATQISGRPTGCNRLVAAWNGGIWSRNPIQAANGSGVGVRPPTGGLYGSALIVDVAEGIAFPYSADAIDGFYGLSETRLHTAPGSALPDLASAETSPGHAQARIFADGRAVDLDFVAGRPDAVSAVLMAEDFFNEYNIAPSVGATSEWVVTLPTRHLHRQQAEIGRRRPFSTINQECEPFGTSYFDRETGPDAPAPTIADEGGGSRGDGFCYHSQVLPWGAYVRRSGPTPLLGSQLLADLGDTGDSLLLAVGNQQVSEGHVVLGSSSVQFLLDGVENAGQAPRHQLHGLPVTGFWVANYVNAQALPGLLANYSTAIRHRTRPRVDSVLVSGEGFAGETITPVAGQ